MLALKRPLLAAKLQRPTPRPNFIRRTHLVQRLSRLIDCKAALVQGPPGSGKTTLLAAFAADHPQWTFRWVSLDHSDDDVRTFWSYVLGALTPDLGAKAEKWRQLIGATLRAEDVDAVLAVLVNEWQPEQDVFLVLDDAHWLTDAGLVASLQFFMRYSSERVRVIFLSRKQVPIPLSEWRIAGRLLEIDNDDLKVSDEEARRFLTETLALPLDDALLQHLIRQAEGWIGGLQLLGLAADQHRAQGENRSHDADPRRIQAGPRPETGSDDAINGDGLDRPVFAYLSETILDRLPGAERDFLIETSVLDYLDADACRAVTGDEDAGRRLDDVVAKNLFVIAVNEKRGLYRYHPLFHEFLQQMYARLPLERRHRLQRRAARYYASRASSDPKAAQRSVTHYLAADGTEEALAVISRLPGGAHSWRLLQIVPLDALEGRPDFVFQRLFSHLAEQQTEPCRHVVAHFRGRLGDATANRLLALLGTMLEPDIFPLERQQWSADDLRRLPLGVETKAVLYAFAAAVLIFRDQEREAWTCLHEAERIIDDVHNPYIRYYALQFQGQMLEHTGALAQCEATFAAMFRLIELHPFLAPTAVTAYISMVGVLLKGGRLAEARSYLDKVKPHGLHSPSVKVAWLYNKLELHVLEGDEEEARAVVRQLLEVDILSSSLYRSPMLRYMWHLGVADKASLAHFQFEQLDEPTWHDDVVQAKRLHMEGDEATAFALLDRRLAALRKGKATWPLVDTLSAKANLLLTVQGKAREARHALREAIHWAYRDQLVAPFLLLCDDGVTMLRSLRHDSAAEFSEAETTFVDTVVERWTKRTKKVSASRRYKAGTLTPRETEVLRVLADGATNKEIADQLYISLATVKTHVVNIYSKLGVANRVEAVAEARRMGLLN